MGRGRAANYDEQRELILARSAELFARNGYPSTSMNQVAEACGLSKATLYHYFKDKYSLLVSIADGHVSRLAELSHSGHALPSEARLRHLIQRIVDEYAGASDAHRVLTEDVKFLNEEDRERILSKERAVVKAFASTVADLRPDMADARLATPLTMLLFGMVNWMFTWLKSDGDLDHAAMGPMVADLFIGGLGNVSVPAPDASKTLAATLDPS